MNKLYLTFRRSNEKVFFFLSERGRSQNRHFMVAVFVANSQ